jgi:hypothetical protein
VGQVKIIFNDKLRHAHFATIETDEVNIKVRHDLSGNTIIEINPKADCDADLHFDTQIGALTVTVEKR